jgi:hypothetical protein
MTLKGHDETSSVIRASSCSDSVRQMTPEKEYPSTNDSVPRLPLESKNQTVSSSTNHKRDNDKNGQDPDFGYPSSSSNSWAWEVATLPRVPTYHPIEPTALRLKGVPVATVASRVSSFMRLHSIGCSYHVGPKVARVDCLALEGLIKFTIHLWRQQHCRRRIDVSDSSYKSQVIVVEFQRRQGCSFECKCLRDKFYQAVAASGHEDDGPSYCTPNEMTCQRRIRIADFGIPANFLAYAKLPPPRKEKDDDTFATVCNSSVTTRSCSSLMDEDEAQTAEALGDCIGLLQSRYHDQNQLGLESLCMLTDSSKAWSSSKMVEKVSQQLIYGDDSEANGFRKDDKAQSGDCYLSNQSAGSRKSLSMLLEQYFRNNERPRSETIGSDHDDDGILEYSQGPHFGIMHLLALKALSNALQSVSAPWSEVEDKRPKFHHHPRFWRFVSKALVYNIDHAAYRPVEAFLSAQCIRLLLQTTTINIETLFVAAVPTGRNSPSHANTSTQSHQEFLGPMLAKALDFGKAHHLGLEQESEKLLVYLGSSVH